MADETPKRPRLDTTSQLALATTLLATPTHELLPVIDSWCAENPGCVSPLGAREQDPLDEDEVTTAVQEARPAFLFLEEEPLPPREADVWVFGDPPQVRANGRAFPRLKVLSDDPAAPAAFADGSTSQLGRRDQLRAATWLVRSLRQRARIYEAVVRAVIAERPELATTTSPESVVTISIRDLAAAAHLDETMVDETTVERVVAACRFQTSCGRIAFVHDRGAVAFRSL